MTLSPQSFERLPPYTGVEVSEVSLDSFPRFHACHARVCLALDESDHLS
jgi:hypothetical protein